MPSMTYDGRSFMLDGRRVWIVSGSIHYARFPRASWADRIHAARLAGLNTVETPVFWSRCEPRPGQFDFDGDNDIRHFVRLVGEAGMHCILRPGPFIGAGWDFGGLPAWLAEIEGIGLRQANAPFLEACSRYITALADQVRDLQVTAPGAGGPIILIQNEHKWTCGHDAMAAGYLGELNRYLREAGLSVPKINANNLWQGVEGEIDCWSGESDMLATLRQLAVVSPDQPRLVIDFGTKTRPRFGKPAPEPASPVALQRRVAEILAAGGQVNVSPFCAGTSFGFWSGRAGTGVNTFLAPTQDIDAPVGEHGGATPAYAMLRRITTFASRFSRVFAHIDPAYQPVVLAPAPDRSDETRRSRATDACTVTHAIGTQGSIAFVFTDPEAASKRSSSPRRHTLLLPEGATLPVEFGEQAVAWCLFDVLLGARATLDYCNLNALGTAGSVFVCFGPVGTVGQLSINGTPLEVEVPKGRKPTVIEHEGVWVVVCSEALVDETFFGEDGVYVGVAGLDASGTPVADGGRQYTRIDLAGDVSTKSAPKASGRSSGKATLGAWAVAEAAARVDGTSPRYASIAGPGDLAKLGSPYGYGWYRIQLKTGGTRRVRLAAPESADRVHLFVDGEPVGVLGHGPGAARDLSVSLKKGGRTIVVLADNMGRVSEGSVLDGRKGLFGHLWEVSALKAGKPSLEVSAPLDPLTVHAPFFGLREGDATHPSRITWAFQHRKKAPLFLDLPPLPLRSVLLVNDEPIGVVDAEAAVSFVLDEERLKRGNNTVQLAVVPEYTDEHGADAEVERALAAAGGAAFSEGVSCLTAKADWAFAKWEAPDDGAFDHISKSAMARVGLPAWWRTTFEATPDHAAPLVLELTGMTKGQVYLNGQHLGRYFVHTADGAVVPPVGSVVLPAAWLREGENEIVLFDEHGGNPAKCRLAFDGSVRPIRA